MINLLMGLKIGLSITTAITIGPKKAQEGETTGEFIDEVNLVYASSKEDAENKLPDGYELVTDDAIYDSTQDGDTYGNTYLAIKRTNDVDNAVTDIRAMNMVGGWSTSAYADLLESQKEGINDLVVTILPAIEDFRDKYDNGSKGKNGSDETGVSFAALILDSFYFDDYRDENEVPYTLLDIFMSDSLCKNEDYYALKTLFLQGNTKVLYSVECALMYSACSSNSVYSFDFDNLEENYTDPDDVKGCDYPNYISDVVISQMVDTIDGVKDYLKPFIDSGFADADADFDEESISAYINSLSQDAASEFNASANFYATLAGREYLGGSLIDFFMNFDPDADDFDEEVVKPFILEMNDAQKAVIPYAGFETLVQALQYEDSYYEDKDGNQIPKYNVMYDLLEENIESLDTKASVFDGVDRRIFEADGIALTTAAMRQNNSKNDFQWFYEADADAIDLLGRISEICCYVGGALMGAVAVTYYGMKAFLLCCMGRWGYSTVFAQGTFSQAINFWVSEGVEKGITKAVIAKSAGKVRNYDNVLIYNGKGYAGAAMDEVSIIRSANKVAKILTALKVVVTVATIVLAVALICFFVKQVIYSQDKGKIVYSDIPEMMVDEDLVDDKAIYTFYTNIKDIDGNITDLTQAEARGHSQWVALYSTKDTRAGNPIYADTFEVLTSLDDELDAHGVSKFGEDGIYNLNKLTKSDAETRYLSFDCVDTLTYRRQEALESFEAYALTIMNGLYGKAKDIYNTWKTKIEAAATESAVNEALQNGMNALNAEKTKNYDIAYPVYVEISEIDLDTITEEEVERIRNVYDSLTSEQQTYIENIDKLDEAEANAYARTVKSAKKNALSEVETYVDSFNFGTNKEHILYECQKRIDDATTVDEVTVAQDWCKMYVDNKVSESKSQAASMFGDGNLGLLFIGIGAGIVVGVGGLWLTLRLLKKRKETKAQ